jgi:hypothetical protein
VNNASLEDAFDSMLRTDYIPLNDTEKLNLLASYYVDYMGYMGQILSPTDQLIVGRRGTGKTTLLYRALVECMRSWDPDYESRAKARTLGVYLDLEKCQSLSSSPSDDYEKFEYAFVMELCDALTAELMRSWPELSRDPSLFSRLFRSAEKRQEHQVNQQLKKLSEVLKSGLPRFVDKSGIVESRDLSKGSVTTKAQVSMPPVSTGLELDNSEGFEKENKSTQKVTYRLAVADVLRIICDLRQAAGIPFFILFVDEFSSLNVELQGRFTTLLKKILGNHAGVYVKLCAITDNYRLGSSIILQRDLFEVSLDLDAFVERSGALSGAMNELQRLTRSIVTQRLASYNALTPERIFDSPDGAWRELSRAAMGVPRTLGIVLKQALYRSQMPNSANSGRVRIRRSDLEYGIRYASRSYINQMLGASRDGVAIPQYVSEIWDALIKRARTEQGKGRQASHFMILPSNEERLRYLNMFFLIHLLEQGRTTKKERFSRSLYCFDYGVCLENSLDWGNDKNIIRQQRFAYDDALEEFDKYFRSADDPQYRCKEHGHIFHERDLHVAGTTLTFCPKDKSDLVPLGVRRSDSIYTEEEIKILGAMRTATQTDKLQARQIADDVGCYIQKVAKFGAKLDREGLITREKVSDRYIYFCRENS